MSIIEKIFSKSPQMEAFIRILYWRCPIVNDALGRLKSYRAKVEVDKSKQTTKTGSYSPQQLTEALRSHGIALGDTLIVHSSMRALAPMRATPDEVIDLLLGLVGVEGTLVMPAFPKYAEAATGTERIRQDLSEVIWTYDVQRTPTWTGALAHCLMKRPDAIRSSFPLNSVVAIGKDAAEMVGHELDTSGATPCGPTSAWAYCANNNAKILMLGVDLAHSLTMIHVAEDCHEDSWPIANWYRFRQFLVKNNGIERLVKVRERHPKWSAHYGERRLNAEILQNGVANQTYLKSLSIISLESKSLLDFLGSKRHSGYPYYLWTLLK